MDTDTDKSWYFSKVLKNAAEILLKRGTNIEYVYFIFNNIDFKESLKMLDKSQQRFFYFNF